MPEALTQIATTTVGSGGAASIDFQNIPATYTDLVVKLSLRGDLASTVTYALIEFNNSSANLSSRLLAGEGSGAPYSATYASNIWTIGTGSTATSSTFANAEVYITNYAGSDNKSVSIDSVTENNATAAQAYLFAGLWSNSTAINRITIYAADGSFVKNKNWVQYSTATLYGVASSAVGAKATGGIITQNGGYIIHTFLSSGTFTPTSNISVEYLVVAGGGAGGGITNDAGGGGGAGGYRTNVGGTLMSLTSGTGYTVTVGAGGAGAANNRGGKGGNSVFSTITSTGGGGGGGGASGPSINGENGGSGGGGGGGGGAGNAGTGNEGGYSPVEGFNGAPPYGGGGGANAAATNANGASGKANSISGTSVYYAGGGSAGTSNAAADGGGGRGESPTGTNNLTAGTPNTGGGGGGAWTSGSRAGANGGSGIVVIRYQA